MDDGPPQEPTPAAVPIFEDRSMVGARFRGVDLSGAELVRVDLDGATIKAANLARLRISGSDLYETTIDAELRDVVVNGVDIAPLVEAELDRRDPDRPLVRPTDAAGFRRGWELLERRWAETVARARTLPAEELHASVEGEWSFVQTLRHLVYASQAWVGRGVLGESNPWHPLSLPWDEAPDMPGVPRDRDARPGLEEVLELRSAAQRHVREVLAGLTDERLEDRLDLPEDGVWPWGEHTVRDCLATVLNEEYEHRRFAERDLDVLTAQVE